MVLFEQIERDSRLFKAEIESAYSVINYYKSSFYQRFEGYYSADIDPDDSAEKERFRSLFQELHDQHESLLSILKARFMPWVNRFLDQQKPVYLTGRDNERNSVILPGRMMLEGVRDDVFLNDFNPFPTETFFELEDDDLNISEFSFGFMNIHEWFQKGVDQIWDAYRNNVLKERRSPDKRVVAGYTTYRSLFELNCYERPKEQPSNRLWDWMVFNIPEFKEHAKWATYENVSLDDTATIAGFRWLSISGRPLTWRDIGESLYEEGFEIALASYDSDYSPEGVAALVRYDGLRLGAHPVAYLAYRSIYADLDFEGHRLFLNGLSDADFHWSENFNDQNSFRLGEYVKHLNRAFVLQADQLDAQALYDVIDINNAALRHVDQSGVYWGNEDTPIADVDSKTLCIVSDYLASTNELLDYIVSQMDELHHQFRPEAMFEHRLSKMIIDVSRLNSVMKLDQFSGMYSDDFPKLIEKPYFKDLGLNGDEHIEVNTLENVSTRLIRAFSDGDGVTYSGVGLDGYKPLIKYAIHLSAFMLTAASDDDRIQQKKVFIIGLIHLIDQSVDLLREDDLVLIEPKDREIVEQVLMPYMKENLVSYSPFKGLFSHFEIESISKTPEVAHSGRGMFFKTLAASDLMRSSPKKAVKKLTSLGSDSMAQAGLCALLDQLDQLKEIYDPVKLMSELLNAGARMDQPHKGHDTVFDWVNTVLSARSSDVFTFDKDSFMKEIQMLEESNMRGASRDVIDMNFSVL